MNATQPTSSRSIVRYSSDRVARTAAALGTLAFLPFGLWAMIAPRSFFAQLAAFHPYNQHFVQDIGAFQLGIGAVLALALLCPGLDALSVALIGSGVGGAAHALSHMIGHDLGGTPTRDTPLFSVIALVLLVAGGLRLAAPAINGRSETGPSQH
ncbi:MAG TPA: hypothetical protein VM143_02265 [Acidimicrobiales bacterium]|nr:hypothetical protein [Acidimicrobiales bacterium]